MLLIELIQVSKDGKGGFHLGKIYLNPQHIVSISEDRQTKSLINESANHGLAPETEFSVIRMHDSGFNRQISVIGDPQMIESKIFRKQRKSILRG